MFTARPSEGCTGSGFPNIEAFVQTPLNPSREVQKQTLTSEICLAEVLTTSPSVFTPAGQLHPESCSSVALISRDTVQNHHRQGQYQAYVSRHVDPKPTASRKVIGAQKAK